MSRVAKARARKPPYSRKRDIGDITAVDAKAYNWCGGTQPPTFSPSWTYMSRVGLSGNYTSMTDVVTPGYRELIARGTVINNGMSKVFMKITPYLVTGTVSQVVGSFSTLGGNAGYRNANYDLYGDWHSVCFGPITADGLHTTLLAKYAPPFSVNSLINAAKIQALNRVEPAAAQGLVSVLETHKTIDMIVDRARKLADVVQAVKGRNVRRLEIMFPNKRTTRYPKRIVLWDERGNPLVGKSGKAQARYGHLPTSPMPSRLDDSRKLWLEFRYGWTPLVHDIVDGLKAMYADDLRKELISRERYTARGAASQSGVVTSASSSSINWAFGTLSAQTRAEHDCTVRAYVLYKYSGDPLLRRLNDFGAFDVPRAIWEIVPWSFVIDWFIPIGDWLGALTPKVGVEVLASGYEVTQKCVVSRTITSWVSNPASGDTRWNTSPIPIGASDAAEMLSIWRVPFLSPPTYPPLEVKLNLKKLVDSVALLKGLR